MFVNIYMKGWNLMTKNMLKTPLGNLSFTNEALVFEREVLNQRLKIPKESISDIIISENLLTRGVSVTILYVEMGLSRQLYIPLDRKTTDIDGFLKTMEAESEALLLARLKNRGYIKEESYKKVLEKVATNG